MTKPLSLVYSDDVVGAIANIISSNQHDDFVGEAFNLSCTENLTLYQILQGMASTLGIEANFKDVQGGANKFFPSVECGPLDISKAQKFLNWSPTPISKAISITTEWFKEASGRYKEEEAYAEKKLLRKL